jgi:hypothetical protein
MEEALLEARRGAAAQNEPPRTPMRWVMLLAFSLATACNGLMYATEAAVEVPAEHFYQIDESAVLALTDIFYAGFIPFVFPAIWLLTRPNGLRWAVVGGGIALAAGAGVRCLAASPNAASFKWMEVGTAILSVSTPLLLGCITQVAANWFPHEERALATSIGVLAAQAGMMVSFILPPIFVRSASTASGPGSGSLAGSGSGDSAMPADTTLKHELLSYAVAQFIICIVSALIGLLFFRTRPTSATETSAAAPTYGGGGSINPTGAVGGGAHVAEAGLMESLKLCYTNPSFWVLSIVFGVVAPTYWTLGQLIDGAMGHAGSGWTETQVYVCGTILQAASLPGFLLGGWLVDKLGDRHQMIVNVSLVLATASIIGFSAALAAAAKVDGAPSTLLYAAVVAGCIACGFFFAMFQPAALELAAECTFPASESASCSILCEYRLMMGATMLLPSHARGDIHTIVQRVQSEQLAANSLCQCGL